MTPKECCLTVTEEDHERARFRSHRKFETDMTSNLLTAECRGEREGLKKVARNLIGMGLTTEQIMTATGLDLDDVLKLKGMM